jgi:hypothetical protein
VTQAFQFSEPIYLSVVSAYVATPASFAIPDTRFEGRSAWIGLVSACATALLRVFNFLLSQHPDAQRQPHQQPSQPRAAC